MENVGTFGTTQGGGDGIGMFAYAYSASGYTLTGGGDDYNSWAYETVETLPDGNTNTVFANYAGQAMLTVYEDTSTGLPTSGQKTATFNAYDDHGRLVMTAHPSAFSPVGGSLYSWDDPTLLGNTSTDTPTRDPLGPYTYLDNDGGLIDVYDYYAGTTSATATTPGDVYGYLKDTKVKQGDGTAHAAVLVGATQYFKKTYTPAGTGPVSADVFPVASQTVYRNANGTGGETTTYAYTWLADATGASTAQAAAVNTTVPVVSAAQNGPGGSAGDTTTNVFDRYGNPLYAIDADGYAHESRYDPVTGALTKAVADAAPYPAYVMADGPLAYWRLGEASGTTAADASGNGFTGSYAGGVALGSAGALGGDADTAGSFDGSTSYANFGHPAAFDFWSGNFALEVWAKPSSVSGFEVLVAKDTDTGRQLYLAANSGRVWFGILGGGQEASLLTDDVVLTAGAWNHVVAQRTGAGDYEVFVDGVSKAITNVGNAFVVTMAATTTDLTVGRRQYPGYEGYFTGQLDDVAVYGHALSTARVAAHYSAGVGTVGSRTHLALTTTVRNDALGRPTKITDPNGHDTYTVYNDTAHEARTYRGWDSSTHTAAGPAEVVRQYRPAAHASSGERTLYTESLTSTAAPSYNGTTNEPTGAESIATSDVQSLSRTLTNDAGQAVEADDYFSLSGTTYARATADFGTASNDSASGHRHKTQYGYDAAGRLNRTVGPTGTVTRVVYDGLGRKVSVWVGTNDAGATDLDPDGTGSPNNMLRVTLNEYDGGAAGDGTLTQVTASAGGGAADRVTQIYYDWRDRPVVTKAGVDGGTGADVQRLVTYTAYDNLDEVTAALQYDGDTITSVPYTDGVPDLSGSSSLLRAKAETSYDDRGRPFESRTFSVAPSTGAVSSDGLKAEWWYDHRGDVVESWASGAAAVKSVYDGAGRPVKVSYTDRNGDAAPGATGTAADAASLTSDHVLQQTLTTYDAASNPIVVTTKLRDHDYAGTGDLTYATGTSSARAYHRAWYYDAADRLTAAVDVGTNGGADSYARPGSVPTRDDTHLVTSWAYDDANRVVTTTDARGIAGKEAYDLLGRTTKTVDAYVNGSPSDADDRTTLYTYDGIDDVLTQTADLPAGQNDQTTQYVYGVSTGGGSDVNSNDLLAEVWFPDKATGAASSGTGDRRFYTYNRLGDDKTYTDQNGTVHTYAYDVLGRLTADAVTALASGVDGAVLRLAYAYDSAGLPLQFTSYDAASAGNVVNQVERHYNGLGQLTAEYQAHAGAVNTSTTPKVQYAYADPDDGSRPAAMTYPNGRVLHYAYSSGVDDAVSRVSSLADDDGSGGIGTHLEEYTYLGLGTIVGRARPEADADLLYFNTGATGAAGDEYTSLDHFGRVVDQRWRRTSTDDEIDEYQYGYDRDSNVLFKANVVNPALSEVYHTNGASNGYDKLNRLSAFSRGALSDANSDGTPDTVSTASRTQSWSLDALGNWGDTTGSAATGVTTDGTAQTRKHNGRNQVTQVGANALAFDANGDATTDDDGQAWVYDAWDRAVGVTPAAGPTLTWRYDAVGRRVSEAPAGGSATDRFYTAGWQDVEDRAGGSSRPTTQTVWSAVYIDAPVLRDRDADASSGTGGYGKSGSGLEERLYAQADANYNVTALVNTSGQVVERFAYDPYGAVTVLNGAADANGAVSDWSADADDASDWGWADLHQGLRYDAATGTYDDRARVYKASMGRPLSPDPAGYPDGMSLYALYRSSPVTGVDPSGFLTGAPVVARGAATGTAAGATTYTGGATAGTATMSGVTAGEATVTATTSAGGAAVGAEGAAASGIALTGPVAIFLAGGLAASYEAKLADEHGRTLGVQLRARVLPADRHLFPTYCRRPMRRTRSGVMRGTRRTRTSTRNGGRRRPKTPPGRRGRRPGRRRRPSRRARSTRRPTRRRGRQAAAARRTSLSSSRAVRRRRTDRLLTSLHKAPALRLDRRCRVRTHPVN